MQARRTLERHSWLLLVVMTASLSACPRATETTEKRGAQPPFPHELHREAIDCEGCHASTAESRSAADNNLPVVAACLDCHEPGDGSCAPCDLPASSRVPGRSRDRDVLFNHRIHLDQGLGCDTCHGEAGGSLPSMDTCTTCHDARPCTRCHVDLEDPRYRPSSHDAFWRHKHGISTRRELGSCQQCHRDSFCQDCHQGDRPTSFHDANYRNIHGLEARATPGRCQSCHTTAFCQNCHAGLN